MSINLERIIDAIDKIKTWVLAFLAGPFIFKLVVDFSGIKLTGVLSSALEHQTVLVIGIFASFALVFKGMHDGITKLQEWRKYRVPPLKKLTDRQRQYLIHVFNTGSLRVEVDTNTYSQQWFKELGGKNYMEYIQHSIFYVTPKGWKRVEQYVKNE